ncbi:hypothetical protein ACFE04_011497 [Oxalis oulophora]
MESSSSSIKKGKKKRANTELGRLNSLSWKQSINFENENDDNLSLFMGSNELEGGFLGLEEIDEVDYGLVLPKHEKLSKKRKKSDSFEEIIDNVGDEGQVENVKDMKKKKRKQKVKKDVDLPANKNEEDAEVKNDEDMKKKRKKKVKKNVELPANEEEVKTAEGTKKKRKKKVKKDAELPANKEDVKNVEDTKKKRKKKANKDSNYEEVMTVPPEFYTWSELRLHPLIMESIDRLGFKEPTPIQMACIPAGARQGKDIIGAAKAGSGKTLAFGLPILQRLLDEREKSAKMFDRLGKEAEKYSPKGVLRALIITPTTELAIQVTEHLKEIAESINVSVVPIVGGMSTEEQELLKKRPEIIVGTPGRLWELMSGGEQHLVELHSLSFFVLDEADQMIENGHFQELQSIIDMLPATDGPSTNVQRKKRQTFVFSATMALSADFQKKLKGGSSKTKQTVNDELNSIDSLCEKAGIRANMTIIDLTNLSIPASKLEESLTSSPSEFDAWNELRLHPLIMKSICRIGFKEPTPIQRACIPAGAHQGKDVIGAAETGSGKTLAFGLPILQRLLDEQEKFAKNFDKSGEEAEKYSARGVLRALIITPTRELAIQVTDHLKEIAQSLNFWVVPIVGGMATEKQERLLKKRPEIVVGTPGRLWELMSGGEQHLVELNSLSFFVLDEADRMIESGHFRELQSIIDMLPTSDGSSTDVKTKKRQTFVFSATIALSTDFRKKLKGGSSKTKQTDGLNSIETLSEKAGIRADVAVIDLTNASILASRLEESFIECREEDKDAYLYYILSVHGQGQTIVFCTSIAALRHISSILRILGVDVGTLHAQMQQRARLKAINLYDKSHFDAYIVENSTIQLGLHVSKFILYEFKPFVDGKNSAKKLYVLSIKFMAVERFRANENGILIATDVAARGLDIPGIRTVVHYQLPHAAEVYVHRSGRTARASADGCSIALITPRDASKFASLCKSFSKESFQRFPLETSYMPEVMNRLSLARQIDQIMRKETQDKANKTWFERNAGSVDLVLDDYESEEDRVNNSKHGKVSSNQLKRLQQELKTLLSRPLQPKTFSHRYLAGAGITPLLQHQIEELAKQKTDDNKGESSKRRKVVVIGQDCMEPLQALRNASHEPHADLRVTGEKRRNVQELRRKRKDEKKGMRDERRNQKKKQKMKGNDE